MLHVTRRAPVIRIANTQLWVHDQDEALAFYTQKLGWEVCIDVTVAELGKRHRGAIHRAGRAALAT
jgi:catechol 2,3-dioxygenase-like lactoylglutathione lyase family enzyme